LITDVNKYKNNTSFSDYKLIVTETKSDGMSTGLFSDEEDGYNLEQGIDETKYVLKGSKPSSSEPNIEDEFGDDIDFGEGEVSDDEPKNDKPFDDEPFDAGVEADEEVDTEKYIQQLSGKLGQTLRSYNETEAEPNFELEKFAVNSVLSATHTGEMDLSDQKDIIKKVKNSGTDDNSDNKDSDNKDSDDDEETDIDFSDDEEDIEEVVEIPLTKKEIPLTTKDYNYYPLEDILELGITPHNPEEFEVDDVKRYYDGIVTRNSDGLTGRVVRFDDGKLRVKITDGPYSGKIFYASPSDVELQLTEGKPSQTIQEGDYQGRKVKLNKPMRGDVKKFKVYVKNDNGNVVKVNFGDKNMEIKRDDPEARKSFRARHKCDQKKDKTSAGYWSCKMWSSKSVSDILQESEKNGNFVSNNKTIENMVTIKPAVKPDTKPNVKPLREVDRPFSPRPRRSPNVQPDPKANNG
jgi:hypothetical protein